MIGAYDSYYYTYTFLYTYTLLHYMSQVFMTPSEDDLDELEYGDTDIFSDLNRIENLKPLPHSSHTHSHTHNKQLIKGQEKEKGPRFIGFRPGNWIEVDFKHLILKTFGGGGGGGKNKSHSNSDVSDEPTKDSGSDPVENRETASDLASDVAALQQQGNDIIDDMNDRNSDIGSGSSEYVVYTSNDQNEVNYIQDYSIRQQHTSYTHTSNTQSSSSSPSSPPTTTTLYHAAQVDVEVQGGPSVSSTDNRLHILTSTTPPSQTTMTQKQLKLVSNIVYNNDIHMMMFDDETDLTIVSAGEDCVCKFWNSLDYRF